METKLKVAGMTCDGCERSITNALQAVPGVREAHADAEAGRVLVDHESVARETLVIAIEEAGYEVMPDDRGLPLLGPQ